MGANAQTSVPTFTAGEILTAANMNISARTGIPVFATTTTRDAAFGGTGEKTLAEGQFAYLEDSNTTQYYDGAAWQTIGITPGLVPTKSQTTFTAVNSVAVNNAFSATYDKYLILVRWSNSSTGELLLQFSVGGVAAATNYNYQLLEISSTTVAASRSTAQTSVRAGFSTNTQTSFIAITVDGPFLAEQTNYWCETAMTQTANTTVLANRTSGNHTTATSYDGFVLITTAAQTITGNYSVYGYGKSV